MTAVSCPVCRRQIDIDDGSATIAQHPDFLGQKCPMSRQPVPRAVLWELAFERSADTVLRLAAELRDDSNAVRGELQAAASDQLREWLIIALAAINIDQTVSEILAWVVDLPWSEAA